MTPGDKVVCIDDVKRKGSRHLPNWVNEGETYTIRRVEGSLTQGVTRVLLNEIVNKPIPIKELGSSLEPGFSIKRFVPYEQYVTGNFMEDENHHTIEINN